MRTEQDIRNDLELVMANLGACTEKDEAIVYIDQLGVLLKEFKERIESS